MCARRALILTARRFSGFAGAGRKSARPSPVELRLDGTARIRQAFEAQHEKMAQSGFDRDGIDGAFRVRPARLCLVVSRHQTRRRRGFRLPRHEATMRGRRDFVLQAGSGSSKRRGHQLPAYAGFPHASFQTIVRLCLRPFFCLEPSPIKRCSDSGFSSDYSLASCFGSRGTFEPLRAAWAAFDVRSRSTCCGDENDRILKTRR